MINTSGPVKFTENFLKLVTTLVLGRLLEKAGERGEMLRWLLHFTYTVPVSQMSAGELRGFSSTLLHRRKIPAATV